MWKLAQLGLQSSNQCRKWLWFSLYFALTCSTFAANFSASLDRTSVVVGEDVTLTLKFEDGQPQEVTDLPAVDGLQRASAWNQSSSISIVNNQQSMVVSYSLDLLTTRVGEFVIPPFHVKMNGQTFDSPPLRLKVIASDPSAPPASFASKPAFLWVVLTRTNLFIGEPTVAEFRIYVRADMRPSPDLQLVPDGQGLTFSRFAQGQIYQRRVGNAVFQVIPLSMAITPVKSGLLSISPIDGSIVLNNPETMDIRSLFAPVRPPVRAPLSSDRIDLQVAPLPSENLPANFNGAVGNYTMTVSAGPTNVTAGDPVTLRIQISGQGAIDSLVLPAQAGFENFKVYPPTAKVNTDTLGIEGSKTFEEIVAPQNSDVKALPAISFSFFDPNQKKYRTIAQPPTPLMVRAATPGTMPALANNARSAEDNLAATPDILPIKQHFGAMAEIAPPLVQQPWFLALQSFPALALLSTVIWRKRKESLANNPRLRRQRHVAQVTRDGLDQLRALAAQNKSDEFFATLFRLLQEQLGERLDVPASSITEAVIEERLRPKGVSESTLASLHEMFQMCNLARYAPIKSSQELAAIIPKLESVLDQVRELKL